MIHASLLWHFIAIPAYRYLFALRGTCRFHVLEEDFAEDQTPWLDAPPAGVQPFPRS